MLLSPAQSATSVRGLGPPWDAAGAQVRNARIYTPRVAISWIYVMSDVRRIIRS